VQVAADAVALARVLLESPGIGVRGLRAAFRSRSGAGVERMEAALASLGDAVVREAGPRNSQRLTLDINQLSDAIRAELERP